MRYLPNVCLVAYQHDSGLWTSPDALPWSTGGSRGIGRGIAAVLVEAGATVVTCGRSDGADPVAGTKHLCRATYVIRTRSRR